MALEKFGAELFAVARDHGCPLGRVLTLGRQNLFFRGSEIPRLEKACGFQVSDLTEDRSDASFAQDFFQRLGVGKLETMDISDYQGCDVIHDLNDPIGEEFEGQYDVVFDGGTLEHVFHFPHAIRNCMRLLKKGGWFLSCTTSNNYNGHGFYQFSPELFYRVFDESNGFQVKVMALGEAVPPGRIYRADDGKELGRRVEMNGRNPLLVIVAAKREEIVPNLFPTTPFQSDYVSAWEKDAVSNGESKSRRQSLPGRIVSMLPAGLRDRIRASVLQFRRKRQGESGVVQVETLSDCLRK